MAAKVIIRTCNHDGAQWLVPDHLRRPPNWAEMRSAKSMASGERLMGAGVLFPMGRGSNVKLAQLTENKERATLLLFCPHCGQQSWKEKKVKRLPPGVV